MGSPPPAEDAQHLINAIQKDYNITVDWEAHKYIGLTVEWDYLNRKVHLHMSGYLNKALLRFKHEMPKTKQNSPHPHVAPQYGAKTQYVEKADTSPPLGKEETKFVQAVAGTLLYYARAVDATILPALSSIATEQAKPTERTKAKVKQLLDYCATQEDAIITYNASKMILAVHSDAGYCNEKNARSRAGGHFFLSNDEQFPPNNGAILTQASIIKAVMSSAAEAEIGALFLNAKEAVYLRQILIEMGHSQPRTPIQTDNTTAEGVMNHKIQPKRTKAMDMRFHWLRDREAQGQFKIYWRPGGTNLADYFTKHFSPAHHRAMRPIYLHVPQQSANQISAHQHPSLLCEGVLKSQWRHVTGPSFHSNLAHSLRPNTTHCLPRFSQLHAGRPAFPQRCPLFAPAHAQPWFGSIRH